MLQANAIFIRAGMCNRSFNFCSTGPSLTTVSTWSPSFSDSHTSHMLFGASTLCGIVPTAHVEFGLPQEDWFLTQPGEITVLLREWNDGKAAATEHLFELVYPQLRKIAGALFRGERPENMLQPTSVVNELFLKLIRQRSLRFEDREHFYSLSARLMRRVLVDHARSEGRQKRDGGVPIPLHEELAWIDAKRAEMMDLDRVLEELDELDPRKCRMVELRFFLGFTAEETAELLNTSKASVDRELRFVRGWLYDRLHTA